ncbi:MAG TPA: YjzC family protein [Clostridia bacterium]
MNFKPGQKAPFSGVVVVVEKYGDKTDTQLTIKKGDIFPPTPKPDQTYVYIKYTD